MRESKRERGRGRGTVRGRVTMTVRENENEREKVRERVKVSESGREVVIEEIERCKMQRYEGHLAETKCHQFSLPI